MPPNSSFEFHSFNPFSINEDFKDNDQDPDVNFFRTQISSLDTSYYIPNEVKEKLEKSCEFCEIVERTLWTVSYDKHLSSFQKWCHTYFPAEYLLGLIWRLATRAQYFKSLAWSLFSTQSSICCNAAFFAKIVNIWYCYNQKQSSGGALQKRCLYEFCKIYKKTRTLGSRF